MTIKYNGQEVNETKTVNPSFKQMLYTAFVSAKSGFEREEDASYASRIRDAVLGVYVPVSLLLIPKDDRVTLTGHGLVGNRNTFANFYDKQINDSGLQTLGLTWVDNNEA